MAKVLQSGLSRELLPIGELRETKLNKPSKEVLSLPYYGLLPKSHLDLIRFRIEVRKRCLVDKDFRNDIIAMCKADVAFFANVMCYIFEPRPPRPIPLKLYDDQADCLVWLAECFGNRDVAVEKTRGIGMSWTMAVLYAWAWLFIDDAKIAITTKDESVLDGPDSNTIMGKIAYILDHVPVWMRIGDNGRPIMKRNLTEHMMLNLRNGATIQGFPPTDQKMRSLRFTSVFYDEFAFFPRDAQASLNASVHTSPNRYFVSTWNGPDNTFYDIMRRQKSTMLSILSYWWDNYDRWQGAYTTEAGRLKIIDINYKYPPDYPFVLDGLLRSPWVDYELRRAGSNIQSALEELYGLQAEAGRKLFKADTINLVNTTVRPHYARGAVELKQGEPYFQTAADGDMKLWGDIGEGKGGPYSAACDIAFGSGASYSTLEIIDLTNGTQVLDYASNKIDPVSFAQYVVLTLRWLNGTKYDGHTYLTFENNGDQGRTFGLEVERMGYGNIMRRNYATRINKLDAPTYLGMRNKDGGMAIMLEMERAIRDGELLIRSGAIAKEISVFDKDEEGKPCYPKGEEGHGDRVMGMAMAWFQGRERLTIPERDKFPTAKQEIEELVARRDNSGWADNWSLRKRY